MERDLNIKNCLFHYSVANTNVSLCFWDFYSTLFAMFSHSLLMFKEVEVEVVEVSGSQQATFVAMAPYLLAERLVTPTILLPVEAAQEDGLQFT